MIPRSLLGLVAGLGLLWTVPAAAQVRIFRNPNRNVSAYFRQAFYNIVPTNIAAGRVVPTNAWPFQYGTQNWPIGGSNEQLRFQNSGSSGSIHYERTISQEQFSVDFSSDGRFVVRRSTPGTADKPSVELAQNPGQSITLSVGVEGKRPTVYRGSTLWGLLLIQPEACQKELLPLLEPFPFYAQMNQTATALEGEVLKLAAAGKIPDRQSWDKLVRQLGDDDFCKREAADRLLRAAGPGIVNFLQQLDYAGLDAEQQFRVRRIVESFHGQTVADTPEQAAAQVVGDPLVWLALLGRPQEATRRAAAKQLAALMGEPIGVDPGADPATQKDQREKLRAKLGPAKTETKPPAKS